jgi:SulP family sulfate permease
MLGIPGGGSGPIQQLLTDFQQLSQTNMKTLAVSVSVLVIIFGARRINNKIPGALIAVIGAIAASYFFDLSADGVAILGTSPAAYPSLACRAQA